MEPYLLLMAVLEVDKGKDFLWVQFLDVIIGAARSNLLKLEGVVQSTRRVATLELLLGRKVACLC